MATAIGTLTKIRLVKTSPMLVRFTLETIEKPINCIVGNAEIGNKILMLEESKYNVAVTGHYNRRKQLVVEDMTIRNPDQFTKKMNI
ncbi:hypothetical protein [Enterococcus gilvus]|uniref:hypothetical protein n=1 Tax=Enterococcus gilvus TaxID=160453 RepID=UPI003ED9E838